MNLSLWLHKQKYGGSAIKRYDEINGQELFNAWCDNFGNPIGSNVRAFKWVVTRYGKYSFDHPEQTKNGDMFWRMMFKTKQYPEENKWSIVFNFGDKALRNKFCKAQCENGKCDRKFDCSLYHSVKRFTVYHNRPNQSQKAFVITPTMVCHQIPSRIPNPFSIITYVDNTSIPAQPTTVNANYHARDAIIDAGYNNQYTNPYTQVPAAPTNLTVQHYTNYNTQINVVHQYMTLRVCTQDGSNQFKLLEADLQPPVVLSSTQSQQQLFLGNTLLYGVCVPLQFIPTIPCNQNAPNVQNESLKPQQHIDNAKEANHQCTENDEKQQDQKQEESPPPNNNEIEQEEKSTEEKESQETKQQYNDTSEGLIEAINNIDFEVIKLSDYKDTVIQWIKENDISITKIKEFVRKEFGTRMVEICDNNKKVIGPALKLFKQVQGIEMNTDSNIFRKNTAK